MSAGLDEDRFLSSDLDNRYDTRLGRAAARRLVTHIGNDGNGMGWHQSSVICQVGRAGKSNEFLKRFHAYESVESQLKLYTTVA